MPRATGQRLLYRVTVTVRCCRPRYGGEEGCRSPVLATGFVHILACVGRVRRRGNSRTKRGIQVPAGPAPLLKALPHLATISTAVAQVFTKRKPASTQSEAELVQQQIAELQAAASQPDSRVRELAVQLRVAMAAIDEGALAAKARLKRLFSIGDPSRSKRNTTPASRPMAINVANAAATVIESDEECGNVGLAFMIVSCAVLPQPAPTKRLAVRPGGAGSCSGRWRRAATTASPASTSQRTS